MANKLFNQQSLDTARLLGETGGVDHDEATIVTDVDNYTGTSLGRDGFNVALGNDGTLTGDTERAGVNIKLKNFIKYLAQKLNSRYLQLTADPLSEIKGATLAAAARVNLNVPSLTDLDTLVTAAVAADTTTLKTANRLSELSLKKIGQGIQDVYNNLNIYSKEQTQGYVADTCDTSEAVTAKIVADTTHFKVQAIPEDIFKEELKDAHKKHGARTNLDVYSIQQTKDEIKLECFTKEQTTAAIAAAYNNRYHYVNDYGGADTDNTIAIQADLYDYWCIRTSNTLNDWVRLPSLTDRPDLKTGTHLYIKAHKDSDINLNIGYYNTDMPNASMALAPRDSASFMFNGTDWEITSNNNL